MHSAQRRRGEAPADTGGAYRSCWNAALFLSLFVAGALLCSVGIKQNGRGIEKMQVNAAHPEAARSTGGLKGVRLEPVLPIPHGWRVVSWQEVMLENTG